MRRITVAFLLIAFSALSTNALADGPSGSREEDDGDVRCGEGMQTLIGRFYVGPDGIEACSDEGEAPDGRVIADPAERYAAFDGDPSNDGQASGFVRLTPAGLACDEDESTDATEDPGGDCP